nr:MAG TPA: hypothetical protein [Caudoviricetes sp.]
MLHISLSLAFNQFSIYLSYLPYNKPKTAS